MSKQHTYDSLNILGVSVDVVSLAQATAFIVARASDLSQPACYVIKPYVEYFDRAAKREELQDLLNHSELSVADGVAVLWAAHYLYAGPRTTGRFFVTLSQIILKPQALRWPLPERAAGINFTWPMLKAGADAHLKIFLIGKESDTEIAAVAQHIQSAIPGINIVGSKSGRDPHSKRGQVSDQWLALTAETVSASGAQLILVGMGFPLQEEVSAKLSQLVSSGLFIGEGGSFDYESFGGTVRKAPAFMQKIGLEWAWRLLLQPSRFGRQLAIPRFIWRIWRAR